MCRITIFLLVTSLAFCRKMGESLSNYEKNYFDFLKNSCSHSPPPPICLGCWSCDVFIEIVVGWPGVILQLEFVRFLLWACVPDVSLFKKEKKEKFLSTSSLPFCNYFSFTAKVSPCVFCIVVFCVYFFLSQIFSLLWCPFTLNFKRPWLLLHIGMFLQIRM